MHEIAGVWERLSGYGQEHLLRFAEGLSAHELDLLLTDIDAIDFPSLPGLIDRYVRSDVSEIVPEDLEPARYYPLDAHTPGRGWDRAAAVDAGVAALRAGKLAVFTVAGGQGTRLGHDGPKGAYPTGCVTGKSLFAIFAEQVRGAGKRYGVTVPWYVMTSPLNHDATLSFFREHEYFGLDRENVMFFPQGVMPSFDKATGKILLSEKHRVATNPDGHGGSLKALVKSGAIDDMCARGVEHISYIQVDNPHVRAIDPAFIGLHVAAPDSSGEFSSKMVTKASWDEKVGVFCRAGGRTRVIEYSDLPESFAKQTTGEGGLRFNAGSIAIHLIGVKFVEKLINDPRFELPYHRAVKKVPFVDVQTGAVVQPEQANGVKLERFVFDACPLAEAAIVVETDRVEEFAPVKNATGVDSIVTSKQIQSERGARWLSACGVRVPRKADGSVDAVIEISPLTASCAEELRGVVDLPRVIEPGARVLL